MAKSEECILCRNRQRNAEWCNHYNREIEIDDISCYAFKGCNFFNLPMPKWSLWGILAIVYPIIRIPIKMWAKNPGSVDAEYAWGILTLVIVVACIAASVYLLTALGKLRTAIEIHNDLFFEKINFMNILYWSQIGCVVTEILSQVTGLADYEWPLMDGLNTCFYALVMACFIIVGYKFNNFEKKYFVANDKFGSWLIGYGIVWAACLVLTYFSEDEYSIFNWIVSIVWCLVDVLYAYNITTYSKVTIPVLFELLKGKHSELKEQ